MSDIIKLIEDALSSLPLDNTDKTRIMTLQSAISDRMRIIDKLRKSNDDFIIGSVRILPSSNLNQLLDSIIIQSDIVKNTDYQLTNLFK